MNYNWNFPIGKNKLKKFIKKIFKNKAKNNRLNIIRIMSNKENNLISLQKSLYNLYKVESKIYKNKNGLGTTYFSLIIQRKREAKKNN